MGCKGRKRREKNYIAAHGGHVGLPPPPRAKDIDAIPSKLRRIMQLTNNSRPLASGDDSRHEIKKNDEFGNEKLKGKGNGKKNSTTGPNSKEKYVGEMQLVNKDLENKQGVMQQVGVQGGSAKRKRKRGDELRILLESQNLGSAKKRKHERKKKYFDAKKQKRKQPKNDDDVDFPQHEVIKFGEVVKAPPKLEFPKKAHVEMKVRQDVSQERVRLQTIENYRHRKGWTSRPGSHVPPLNSTRVVSEV